MLLAERLCVFLLFMSLKGEKKRGGKNRLFHFGTEIVWETTENSELALTYSESQQHKRRHFEGSDKVLRTFPEPLQHMYYPLFLFISSMLLRDMTSHFSGSCKFKAIPRKNQGMYIGYR